MHKPLNSFITISFFTFATMYPDDNLKKSPSHKVYCISTVFKFLCHTALLLTCTQPIVKIAQALHQVYHTSWLERPWLINLLLINGLRNNRNLIGTIVTLYIWGKIGEMIAEIYSPYQKI